MFTSYGVAGILGPLLAGVFKDAASAGDSPVGWVTPFLIAGVACLIGALDMMFTRAPESEARKPTSREGGFPRGLAPDSA